MEVLTLHRVAEGACAAPREDEHPATPQSNRPKHSTQESDRGPERGGAGMQEASTAAGLAVWVGGGV